MNFRAVMLGRKQYADARVVTNLENPAIVSGGAPSTCGISKTLSARSFSQLAIKSLDFGLNRLAPTNSEPLIHSRITNSRFEPRCNRCKCTGFWPRTRHAFIRNFVTYDRSEQHLRPQLGLYAGAFGAGVIAGTWAPANPNLLAKGYQGVTTQVVFGMRAHWLGEFAPDIKRVLQKKKSGTSANDKIPRP